MNILRALIVVLSGVILNFCLLEPAYATDPSPKVVVISLDAFGAATLQDPYIATPALHKLNERRGVCDIQCGPSIRL